MVVKVHKRDYCMEERSTQQPTKEELKFLQLRKKLKNVIRKKMSPLDQRVKTSHSFSCDQEYGSFFGPSRPAIAPRLLKESSLLVLDQISNVALARISSYYPDHTTPTAGSDSNPQATADHTPVTGKIMESRKKAQMLRLMRDYSFLSSDNASAIPPISNSISDQNVCVTRQKPEAPTVRPRIMKKSPLPNHARKTNKENRAANCTARLPTITPAVSKKASIKIGESRVVYSCKQNQKKVLPVPSKGSVHSSSSILKQAPERVQHLKKLPKAQIKNSGPAATSQLRHTKRKRPIDCVIRHHEEEEDNFSGARAISMIRKMFNYDPNKYHGNDSDDRAMVVASFEDIQKEERRSAKIARKEDQEELRKIVAEETRDRLKKETAKKRKLITRES